MNETRTLVSKLHTVFLIVFIGAVIIPLVAGPASADDVVITPTGAGAIGTNAFTTALNWVAQYGLYAAGGGILMGGGMAAYSRNQGGSVGGSTGQKMIIGGITGAFVIGLAGAAVNLARTLGATA